MAHKSSTSIKAKAEPVDSLIVEPSHTQNIESLEEEASESSGDEVESEEESPIDSQEEFPAIEILDQTPKKYLIRWGGNDPKTKKPWKPTWEPRENANADLVAHWEESGKQRWRDRIAAEKEAKEAEKGKKRRKKPARLTKKREEEIRKVKEESPDPQPSKKTLKRTRRSREISTTDSPAPELPMTRPIKRRLAVPDSEASSPAPSEPQQSKKEKSDAQLLKTVTFQSQTPSIPSTSAAGPQTTNKGKQVELIVVSREEEEPLAPAASSNESTNTIVPDSQPAPSKPFDTPFIDLATQMMQESIDLASQMMEESPQNSQIASQSNAIAGPSRPPPPRSFPTMDSPATTHSELGSEHAQDDDVPIWNDFSQQDAEDEEEGEEEVRNQQLETQYYSPARPVHAPTSRQINRFDVPPISAFFPAEPESARSDPIEDPDSSPFRSRQQLTTHHSFNRSLSPFSHPQPRKARLELQLGPSEEDETELFSQSSAAFEAERMASAVHSYVSDLAPLNLSPHSIHRNASSSQTIKRPASRPVVAPIAFEIETGGGVGVSAATVSVSQPVVPDDDGSDSELDLDDLNPGGVNEAYFTSDLLIRPLDLDEFIDYECGSQLVDGVPNAEPVDAGEGGNSNGGGSSRGGYPYSAYPSNYTQQQQQQQQSNQSQASPIPGFITSGSSSSYAGNGYGGGSASGGGYPYPSHLQPSSSHAQSSKREYEEDREESAKRARREQEQQQHQYYQQYPSQQYPQPGYPYPQSHSAYPPPGSRPNPETQYSQGSLPHSTHHHHSPAPQQQYTRLPPMQTAPPPQSHSDYSRSSSQLPPIQQAIYNTGYPHNPSPHSHPQPVAPSVSVAAASPPLVSSPVSVPISAPAPGRLTSPSIARVQSVEAYRGQPWTGSTKSPSPLTSLQPLPPQDRISSPAPNLDGVNSLLELVRDSPHIEANDGTKEEIMRFLRDPRGYGTDRPLARADFWAFELRRPVLDGGERVDFIILHTREGTFQLKRCTPTTIPVEFARSLVHAPTRVRGSTPAVDAMPTLQSSASTSVSSGPLAVSSMTREQLEAEVNALRLRLTTAETELATLPTLSAENAKLKTEVQTLTQSNKSLKNSRDSAQQDMSYIQEQYSIASSAAMARAQEAEIAETEAARLQGLLSEGLKQKDLFYKSEVARWRLEVARMKKEVEFTRAERRKMDERGIREKAGKWDEVVARRKIKEDRRLARGSAEEEEESDLDSEEEIVSKILLSDRMKSPTPPASTTTVVKLIPDDFATSTQSSTVDEGFRCEWRNETQSEQSALPTSCGLVLPTREALMEHCIGHIPLS